MSNFPGAPEGPFGQNPPPSGPSQPSLPPSGQPAPTTGGWSATPPPPPGAAPGAYGGYGSIPPPPGGYGSPGSQGPGSYGMPDPAYAALESRSTTVLVLGILSLVACGLLGPFAWSMGDKVRKEARAMGRDEPGNNKGGRICGMIGSILLGLGIVVTIGLLVAALAFGARRSTSISRSGGFPPTSIEEMQPTTVDAVNQPTAPVGGSEFLYGKGACAPADGSAPKTTSFMQEPQLCINRSMTYTAVVETTKGSYTILLEPERAPGTVNNFVNLARYHYFDDTPCHRIIKNFMAQCGDPTGSGIGGPGYSISDELPFNATDYQPGTVAMANSGPNTNGSQFFTMFRPGLQPNYTIFGHVIEGMGSTVKALNAVGNPGEGAPIEPVRILKVTITES